jgi:hypothetical protein
MREMIKINKTKTTPVHVKVSMEFGVCLTANKVYPGDWVRFINNLSSSPVR